MDELELARKKRNAVRREQYRLDGGKRKAENQAWKDAHREQVREASREYQRLYRLRFPEKAEVSRAKSYTKHRIKRLAATKAWFASHPGYDAKKQAEYRVKDPVRYILRNAKNRAKALGREFSLVREDVVIPEFCPALGLKLEKGSAPFQPCSPSIDRVDSSKGYVRGNVQVVSWRANRLKADATIEELEKVLAYMKALP
jgi:hypothetical protein